MDNKVFEPGDTVYLMSVREAISKHEIIAKKDSDVLELYGGRIYKIFSETPNKKYRLDGLITYAIPKDFLEYADFEKEISEDDFMKLIEGVKQK